MSKSYADESRRAWGRTDNQNPTFQELQLGALQRIADASEAMAKSHMALIADRDWWKRQADSRGTRMEAAQRSNASLRGQITKLKKAKAA